MERKVVLITGSTSGLGLHTAKNLYLRGATVIITCRDECRGRAALDAVQSQFKSEHDSLSGRLHLFSVSWLDLTCYKSILNFCNEIKSNFNRIDVLINNAGIMGLPFELSRNGVEMHFATNAFGHFVLVNNLLPLLESSIDGRIIIVSSGLYKYVNNIPTLRQLMGEQDWDYQPRFAYAVSKLANCLHAVELAKRLSSNRYNTKVYAIRPGFVGATELGRETHWLLRSLASPVTWIFSKSLDQGIEPIIHCAITTNDELNSGALYHGCQEEEYAPMVTETNAANMWDIFMHMEELILIRCHILTEEEIAQAKTARNALPLKS
ncbi:oxidoreductase, short chain dehydrogenase/reductase family protein [Dictyocaulus viviparus]|uniref:Oxidoreductase, short chain dehydrogenase/reductase family protein n=1 Tax=Dictyocaulus viviparus TaxID=29172 RepID=A0A0D8XUF7_DICVI|nr:oxidoreductase, short chain dehydrogenase/reductase family protein [Dictyocaulus viviparus]